MLIKLQKKSFTRLQFAFWNVANNLFPLFINILISLSTIRLAGVELWGSYSKILLVVTFSAQLLAWGNKEFLLREFSKNPSQIEFNWKATFNARNLLLLPAFIAIYIFSGNAQLWLFTCSILLLRYICHSYEVIILYNRNFLFRVCAEIAGGALICIVVLGYGRNVSIQILLYVTVIAELIKATLYILYFKKGFLPAFNLRPALQPLKSAFPFFLLTFSGLMLSRLDQFIVALVLPLKSLGIYQVYMNFLLLIQSLSNFILQPILKTLYRSKPHTISKTARSLFTFGFLLSISCMIVLKFILEVFYGFSLEAKMLIAGWLLTLPVYYYLPYIYYLYKINKPHRIVIVNTAGIIITILLILLLKNGAKDKLFIILSAAALTQWLMVITYVIMFRKARSLS